MAATTGFGFAGFDAGAGFGIGIETGIAGGAGMDSLVAVMVAGFLFPRRLEIDRVGR